MFKAFVFDIFFLKKSERSFEMRRCLLRCMYFLYPPQLKISSIYWSTSIFCQEIILSCNNCPEFKRYTCTYVDRNIYIIPWVFLAIGLFLYLENNVRGLASEFQRHSLQGVCRLLVYQIQQRPGRSSESSSMEQGEINRLCQSYRL